VAAWAGAATAAKPRTAMASEIVREMVLVID
jgi:hypothetical protein